MSKPYKNSYKCHRYNTEPYGTSSFYTQVKKRVGETWAEQILSLLPFPIICRRTRKAFKAGRHRRAGTERQTLSQTWEEKELREWKRNKRSIFSSGRICLLFIANVTSIFHNQRFHFTFHLNPKGYIPKGSISADKLCNCRQLIPAAQGLLRMKTKVKREKELHSILMVSDFVGFVFCFGFFFFWLINIWVEELLHELLPLPFFDPPNNPNRKT